MRTIALLTAATLAIALPRSAEAGRGDCGPLCQVVVLPLAIGLGAGLVGGYAYGTGYFVVHDLRDEPHSSEYGGGELMLHSALTTAFAGVTIDAARAGHTGTAIATGGIAALHLTLAAHGAGTLWGHRDELVGPSPTVVHWTIGSAFVINTLGWAAQWPGPHGRGYGIAEVSVNAPLAIGFGVLARDRMHEDRGTGSAILYSGMAAVSAIYVAHGIKTIALRHRNKLDLLGTDITPTIVDDGHAGAPGLGASGTF